MAKYSIIILCSLFSCFIAVYPLKSIDLQNEGNNDLPYILDILRINTNQGRLKDDLVKSVAPSRQASKKGWFWTANTDVQKDKLTTLLSAVDSKTKEFRTAFDDTRGTMATLDIDRRIATTENPNGGLSMVHTDRKLSRDVLFEIRIVDMQTESCADNNLAFGVTTDPLENAVPPENILEIQGSSFFIYWRDLYVRDESGWHPKILNYIPSIPKGGDQLGLIQKSNGEIYFYFNGIELEMAGNLDAEVYGVVDMNGCYKSVQICNP